MCDLKLPIRCGRRNGGDVLGLTAGPIELFVLLVAIASPAVTTVMRGKCTVDRHGRRRQSPSSHSCGEGAAIDPIVSISAIR